MSCDPNEPKDAEEMAKAAVHRATLDHAISRTAPGVVRDILIQARNRIPIADPGAEEPSVSPNRPPDVHGGPGTTDHLRTDLELPNPLFPVPGGVLRDPPTLLPCPRLAGRAHMTLAASENRWWQNWGKSRSYVAERAFFPRNVYELSEAVLRAETDNMPVRAVGGGWSFSDVNIPGDVAPWRPFALGIDALAAVVPPSLRFPGDPYDPIISSVARPGVPGDARGTLAMFSPLRNAVDRRWTYRGSGDWSIPAGARGEVLLLTGRFGTFGDEEDLASRFTDAEIVAIAFRKGFRPIPARGPDGPGTLLMSDTTTGDVNRNYFYNGDGVWTAAPQAVGARRMGLSEICGSIPRRNIHPRRSTPEFSLLQLRTPEPVCLIHTQHMASSLQQNLPNIQSEGALLQTRSTPLTQPNKYYFHVEGGITMAALNELLKHQSPPLAIQATGGNPGATLAGSLATATHGGEYNLPLLTERVKAVHMVGPGGLQWWIEGDDSIADPDKLLEWYPCLSRDRIITGSSNVGGLSGQDWLNAVVVSLGCMGAVYSLVIEVVPMFGIHEAVVETDWSALLARARFRGRAVTQDDLRGRLAEADKRSLGADILNLLQDGNRNGSRIPRQTNRYIDLAIDPNGPDANWTCWVLNREETPTVPFDHKPPPKDVIGRVGEKLAEMISDPDIANRLMEDFNVDFIRRLQDQGVPIDGLYTAQAQLPGLLSRIARVTSSKDTINAALDVLTERIDAMNDVVGAQAIVSAVFSGLLGIENGRSDHTAAAAEVGAIGFPASGIMGTAIEIALPVEEAWPFLQTEILDRITSPFFGYVSVRVCPATRAHLGMQQFAPSVMIEVVAFGTRYARTFVRDLERRTVERIRSGLPAMLHWGLENEQLDAEALRAIRQLTDGASPKLAKFLMARIHLKQASPMSPDVFANATTRRLVL